ncbi:hypothetical protein SAMN04487967_3415 [Natronorubrum sediminis]|uniref:Uncharacterized protein n=1 Tax=Natronorubrum sediminis TaxID=640943 RepID=A0A1H6G5H8_9EURY|nr:hypothetical protein [Natronorubrum sediminis]SEH17842.1 hypothetical protein SAMN04487967_3415 [Natronorubrum sediminis]
MEITAFEARFDEESAVERTRNLSAKNYVYAWLGDYFGWGTETEDFDVRAVYYPDYIAYTSATIRKTVGGEKQLKFLAGVDAITGKPGEIDVELPNRNTIDIDPTLVIKPEIDEDEVRSIWREWLFKYVGRFHRATEMPEYSLDDLELVYTPYWVIDFGSAEESLAVSDLTGRTAKVEEIDVIEDFYLHHM